MLAEGINESEFAAHKKLLRLVGKNKQVLEIGCGGGFLSERMLQSNCTVMAIEIDKEKAEEAKKRCNSVIAGDVETMELKLRSESFDVLLFADVLEHLKQPAAVLQKTKKFLKKNGLMIASIPNAANWKMRLKLLFGKFDYESQGIMDETHLHFYTLKTAKQLVESSGYEIEKIDFVASAPLPNPFHLHLVDEFKEFLSKLLPGLFSFQFLIVARKVHE